MNVIMNVEKTWNQWRIACVEKQKESLRREEEEWIRCKQKEEGNQDQNTILGKNPGVEEYGSISPVGWSSH